MSTATYTGIRKLFWIYRRCGLLTRLHVALRYVTCPFASIEAFVPRQGLVVDYGCGHGLFTHLLARAASGRRAAGFDVDRRKIEEACKTVGDADNVCFLSDWHGVISLIEKADCVVINDVLCYVPDGERKELLQRLSGCLKAQAVLIIKDQKKTRSFKYAWLCIQEFFMARILRVTEAKALDFFEPGYLTGLLTALGLTVSVHDLSSHYPYPHVVFVCQKQ